MHSTKSGHLPRGYIPPPRAPVYRSSSNAAGGLPAFTSKSSKLMPPPPPPAYHPRIVSNDAGIKAGDAALFPRPATPHNGVRPPAAPVESVRPQVTQPSCLTAEDLSIFDDPVLARELIDFDFTAFSQPSPPASNPQPAAQPTINVTPIQRQASTETVDSTFSVSSAMDRPDQSNSLIVALRQQVEQLKQQNVLLLGEKEILRKNHNQRQAAMEALQDALNAKDMDMPRRIEEATKELVKKTTMLQVDLDYYKQQLDDKNETVKQITQKLATLQRQPTTDTAALTQLQSREKELLQQMKVLEQKLEERGAQSVAAESIAALSAHTLKHVEPMRAPPSDDAVFRSLSRAIETLTSHRTAKAVEALLTHCSPELSYLFGCAPSIRTPDVTSTRVGAVPSSDLGDMGSVQAAAAMQAEAENSIPATCIDFGISPSSQKHHRQHPAAGLSRSSSNVVTSFVVPSPTFGSSPVNSARKAHHEATGISPAILRQRAALFGASAAPAGRAETVVSEKTVKVSTDDSKFGDLVQLLSGDSVLCSMTRLARCLTSVTQSSTFSEAAAVHGPELYRIFLQVMVGQQPLQNLIPNLLSTITGSSSRDTASSNIIAIHSFHALCAARVLYTLIRYSSDCKRFVCLHFYNIKKLARESTNMASIIQIGRTSSSTTRSIQTALAKAFHSDGDALTSMHTVLESLTTLWQRWHTPKRVGSATVDSSVRSLFDCYIGRVILSSLHEVAVDVSKSSRVSVTALQQHLATNLMEDVAATALLLGDIDVDAMNVRVSNDSSVNQAYQEVVRDANTAYILCCMRRVNDAIPVMHRCLLWYDITKLSADGDGPLLSDSMQNVDRLWLFKALAALSDYSCRSAFSIIPGIAATSTSSTITVDFTHHPSFQVAELALQAHIAMIRAYLDLLSQYDNFGTAALTGCYLPQDMRSPSTKATSDVWVTTPTDAKHNKASPDITTATTLATTTTTITTNAISSNTMNSNSRAAGPRSGKSGSLGVSPEAPSSGSKRTRRERITTYAETPSKTIRTEAMKDAAHAHMRDAALMKDAAYMKDAAHMKDAATMLSPAPKLSTSTNIANLMLLPRLVDVLVLRIREFQRISEGFIAATRHSGRARQYVEDLKQFIVLACKLLHEFPLRPVLVNAVTLVSTVDSTTTDDHLEDLSNAITLLDRMITQWRTAKDCAEWLRESID